MKASIPHTQLLHHDYLGLNDQQSD